MAKSNFWGDFKTFITKGNVVDMAVGVVIGGSFSKIVTGLVNYIINPFVGLFVKTGDLSSNLKTIITPEVLDETGAVLTAEVAILWGTWLQTIIDFLITALCIFTVLRILMEAKKRLEAEKTAAKAAEEKAAADKVAEEKAAADKAAAEAAAVEAAKQEAFKASIINQEALLTEIRDLLKKQ